MSPEPHAEDGRTSVQATVIVPTHDRDATLDLAVASIQAQTVRDIEIVIAGDGVTPAVRAVIDRLAAQDPRIRFLDYEKAPGRGYDNRHRALLASRGEHIFYCDDDDLWLPDHVEKLGQGLADAEIVDSAVLSVARSGRLHRAFVNHSHPSERHLLAQSGRRKTIFDTHLAHTRSLYLRLGNAWARGIADMLSEFARSDAAWRTYNRPTALSLHGGIRHLASHAERREEVAAWGSRIAAGLSASDVADEALGVWYLARQLQKARPQESEQLWDYLERMGVARSGIAEGAFAPAGSLIAPAMPEACAADMETAFAFLRGTPTNEAAVERILLPLMEPVLGLTPRIGPVAHLLCRVMPPKLALRVVSGIQPQRPHDTELKALLLAYLRAVRGKPDRAMSILVRGGKLFDLYAPDAALMLGRLMLRTGRRDEALRTLRLASEQFSRRLDVRLVLAETIWANGGRDEAMRLCMQVLEAAPGNPTATRLLTAIEAAAASPEAS